MFSPDLLVMRSSCSSCRISCSSHTQNAPSLLWVSVSLGKESESSAEKKPPNYRQKGNDCNINTFTILAEGARALDPKRGSSMYSCHGVSINQFIFITILARIQFNIFKVALNQWAKPTDLKWYFWPSNDVQSFLSDIVYFQPDSTPTNALSL